MADVEHRPSRQFFGQNQTFIPTLQPLLTWQSISLFWLCGLMAARFPIPAILATLFIFFIDERIRHKARVCAAIILFLIGFLSIHILHPPRPDYPIWAMQDQKPSFCRIEGTVIKTESLSNKRLRITLKDVRSLEHKDAAPLNGLMIWTWEAAKNDQNFEEIKHPQKPLAGQKIQISARIRTTEGFKNVGNMDFGFYWQSQGVFWRIWSRGDYGKPKILGEPDITAKLRQNAITSLEQSIFHTNNLKNSAAYQAYAFLPSLLFGEKYHLTHASLQNMQAASLIHSLALSGQHLAVVGLGAFMIAILIYLTFPKILLILPHKKWLGLLSLPLALLYLWLGNAPASLIRAALMLALALIFYWKMRTKTLGDILLITLLLITCYNPLAIFNLGLQLSVLCVASISLVLPLLRRIPKINMENKSTIKIFALKFMRGTIQIFIISLVIQVAMLPVFLYYFAPAGPWFISNIFWLPVLGFWVLPLAALGLILACIWPEAMFVNHILSLAAKPCEVLLNILQWMRTEELFNFPLILRPHWSANLAWLALCLALALWVGRSKMQASKNIKPLLIIAICLLFAGPVIRYLGYFKHDVRIDTLDVGQGQSICITLSGGQRILVDGGGSYSKNFDTGKALVIPSLVYNAPPRLWAVINTHPDMDHLRGLMAVLEHMQVGTFYHNGQKFSASYVRKLKELKNKNILPPSEVLHAGMTLSPPSLDDSIKLQVLNPSKIDDISTNNASIVLRLVHEKNNVTQGIAILCGDAEKPALQHILNSNQDLQASIIVLPHHGSKDALLPSFYEKVAAKIATASVAKYNHMGLPHPEVQQALAQKNIPLYFTAKQGAIRVIWSNKNPIYKFNGHMAPPAINIKTQNNSAKLALHNIFR